MTQKLEMLVKEDNQKYLKHLEGTGLRYLAPPFGPHYYHEVGRVTRDFGYGVPTGNETAPLIHGAYCGDNKDNLGYASVRRAMKERFLWVFNRNLWADKGRFVIHDRKAVGLLSRDLTIQTMDLLERKLEGGKEIKGVRFSEDGSVRFAPRGSYALGEMDAWKLAEDGGMIADYGIEGAKLMAEAASSLPNKPRIFGSDIQEGQCAQLQSGLSTVSQAVGRLRFVGNEVQMWMEGPAFQLGNTGYAFGILKAR